MTRVLQIISKFWSDFRKKLGSVLLDAVLLDSLKSTLNINSLDTVSEQ